MLRCTVPCMSVARPVLRVSVPTTSVRASNTISLASRPRVNGVVSQIEATAIAGIVSPMPGQSRAEGQIEAGLQPVVVGRPYRGTGLWREHEQGDHDADDRARSPTVETASP